MCKLILQGVHVPMQEVFHKQLRDHADVTTKLILYRE